MVTKSSLAISMPKVSIGRRTLPCTPGAGHREQGTEEADTSGAISGGERPREPTVRAAGPTGPPWLPAHVAECWLAALGQECGSPAVYWSSCCLGWCGFVKRVLDEILGNSSLAPKTLLCYLGQITAFPQPQLLYQSDILPS